MSRRRLVPSFALVIAWTLVTTVAGAQTISDSGQGYPNRFVNGVNEGAGTRPMDLNPLGVSYQDCIDDMTLQFSVTLSGFNGSDNVEVWAGTSSDCTAHGDRGIGSSEAACWGVAAGVTNPIISTPQTFSFNVRVQDLVGWQQAPPSPAQAAHPPAMGMAACSAQPTFAAVALNIVFLAVNADGDSDGTPYLYNARTDLVGPPAPRGVAIEAGNEGVIPSWTPNTDTDAIGYDVFLAPPAGQPGQGAGCPGIPGADDAGAGTAGGISSVPAAYLVAGGGDGLTVRGESTGAYAIAGLTDGTEYDVAVAAVDAFGNVGPTSVPSCTTPIVDGGAVEAGQAIDAGPGVDAGQNEGPST
ncbi:MAG TPA: hypothetical protein VIJ22_07075, partial [Polyangiaceae bacterium]